MARNLQAWKKTDRGDGGGCGGQHDTNAQVRSAEQGSNSDHRRCRQPLELQQRRVESELPALVKDAKAWHKTFAEPRPRTAAEREVLVRLRTDLRQMLTPAPLDTQILNSWLDRIPIKPRANADGVTHEPADRGLAGLVIASVIDALAAGQWARLKACHDCQWVFYDWTRNFSRRWCGMNAEGPEGRACGSIAKVRRYRQRRRLPDTNSQPKPGQDALQY